MKAKETKDYSKLPKELFTTPKQGPLTRKEYEIKKRLTELKPIIYHTRK
jgi:hypothetical protein